MINGADADLLGTKKDHATTRAAFEDLGFVAVKNAATVTQAQDLTAESTGLLDQVQKAVRDDAHLRYSAGIAMLGPKALAFLQSGALSEALHALTGARFVLTQNMSCITVYKAGDQLGVHLDQPAERCVVTCILYLTCSSPAPHALDSGLQLKIYGEDKGSTKHPPRTTIPTIAGLLVLGRGSRVWHERPRLQPQENVVALTACFGKA